MNFNKYISKFLAKSLLVSMGISCFGSSVSYMMEKGVKNRKNEAKNRKDEVIDEFINYFKGLNEEKREELSSKIFGDFNGKGKKQQNSKFLSQKRRKPKPRFKHEPRFNDHIIKMLKTAISFNKKNSYSSNLTTKDRKNFAIYITKFNLLLVAKIIYTLEKLSDAGCLDGYCKVQKNLSNILSIKKSVIENEVINDNQFLGFCSYLNYIFDKIKSDTKGDNSFNKVFGSISTSFAKPYFKDSILKMFKTLDYCEKEKIDLFKFPELLIGDVEENEQVKENEQEEENEQEDSIIFGRRYYFGEDIINNYEDEI